ncbi:interferon a3-like [Nelusetta ayraudi]|uniref:interferon a3-like n=1 Tax=Nelusetta ayraudi TaxID=303726 RepID=UPI003F71315C
MAPTTGVCVCVCVCMCVCNEMKEVRYKSSSMASLHHNSKKNPLRENKWTCSKLKKKTKTMMMMMMMMLRLLCVCVSVSVFTATASPLKCKWLDHRFRQYSKESLDLLDDMVRNCTNCSTGVEQVEGVDFPSELYKQMKDTPATDKLAFAVLVLNHTAALLDQDQEQGSAPWDQNTVDSFLNLITQQADGLHSCIGGHRRRNSKLRLYFQRLTQTVLHSTGHSAAAWEVIRSVIGDHLRRTDQLVSPLISTN